MTKNEFRTSLPYFIEHPNHGQGELEAYESEDGLFAAQYRHADGSVSYGGISHSWQELYDDLRAFFKKKGHCKGSVTRRQNRQADKEIDALVYQLYGLTEEEVRLVEGK